MSNTHQQFSTDEIEFRQSWDKCAGERATLGGIRARVQQLAADAFISGDDAVAMKLRDFAREIAKEEREKDAELQLYVNEAERREAH